MRLCPGVTSGLPQAHRGPWMQTETGTRALEVVGSQSEWRSQGHGNWQEVLEADLVPASASAVEQSVVLCLGHRQEPQGDERSQPGAAGPRRQEWNR